MVEAISVLKGLPGVIFVTSAISLLALHLRSQLPYFRTIKKIELEYRREAKDWKYWQNLRLRMRFMADEKAMFDESDSVNVRELKRQLVQQRMAIKNSFGTLVLVGAVGFGLTFIAIILKAMLVPPL